MAKINRLTIELVPETCHYINVRSNVSSSDWNTIRNKAYNEANHLCEVCGQSGIDQGFSHPVECHERWNYDNSNHIQKLIGFIALCPKCHEVKHIGLANINNRYDIVIKHFMKINKIKSRNDANQYVDETYKIWKERSEHDWKLDISYIDEYVKTNDDIFDVLKKKRKLSIYNKNKNGTR